MAKAPLDQRSKGRPVALRQLAGFAQEGVGNIEPDPHVGDIYGLLNVGCNITGEEPSELRILYGAFGRVAISAFCADVPGCSSMYLATMPLTNACCLAFT